MKTSSMQLTNLTASSVDWKGAGRTKGLMRWHVHGKEVDRKEDALHSSKMWGFTIGVGLEFNGGCDCWKSRHAEARVFSDFKESASRQAKVKRWRKTAFVQYKGRESRGLKSKSPQYSKRGKRRQARGRGDQ